MCHLFINQQTHHHHSTIINIYWILRITVKISESISNVTESASTLSSLIEYALGDFIAAINKDGHYVYIGTAVEIDDS